MSKTFERKWLALSVLLLALFMELVDVSSVNLALPTIKSDLGASSGELQWVMAAYSLAFALTLLPGGHLGDRWGRRHAFFVGVGLFGLASFACGVASSPIALIVSRFVQGAGGGVMMPQVLASTRMMFVGAERSRAFGFYGAVVGLGTILGPLIGGVLVDADVLGWAWRSIFFVNLPVVIVALIGTALVVPNGAAAHNAQGKVRRLFALRSFSAGLAVGLMTFTTIAGFFLVASVFVQSGLAYSTIEAALIGVPFSIGAAVGSIAAAQMVAKFGRTVLTVGFAVHAAGIVTLALLAHKGFSAIGALVPLFLAGVGIAAVIVPLVDFTLSDVDDNDVGLASGLANLTQPLGGAFGVALIGAVFFRCLGGGGAYSEAFALALAVQAALAVLAALLVFALPPRAIHRSETSNT